MQKLDVQRLKLSRFPKCVCPESIASHILLGARCFSNSFIMTLSYRMKTMEKIMARVKMGENVACAMRISGKMVQL